MLVLREHAIDTISNCAMWFPFGLVGVKKTGRGAGHREKDEKTNVFSLSSFRQEQIEML